MAENSNTKEIIKNIGLFLFFFLLTLFLYRDYISQNLLALSGDGCGYMNLFAFSKKSIENGIVPLWNPYMNAGKPFATVFTNLFFYPIRIIFSFLDTKWFFYTIYAFHLAVGAVFFGKYIKIIGCTETVSVFMSIVYYFSIHLGGFRKHHLILIFCTVYLPMILYYVEKYFLTKSVRYLYITSLLMTFQLLAGFPQYALYTDLAVGMYLIIHMFANKSDIWVLLKQAVVWGVLYIGLSMMVIIPYMELFLNYSGEGASRETLEQFQSYSINPVKIVMMICPTIFNSSPNNSLTSIGMSEIQIEIFLGTVIFALVVYGFWKCRDIFKVRMAIAYMICTFVFAMNGTSTTLSSVVYKIPLISAFRCSSRVLFIFIFLVMLLRLLH